MDAVERIERMDRFDRMDRFARMDKSLEMDVREGCAKLREGGVEHQQREVHLSTVPFQRFTGALRVAAPLPGV